MNFESHVNEQIRHDRRCSLVDLSLFLAPLVAISFHMFFDPLTLPLFHIWKQFRISRVRLPNSVRKIGVRAERFSGWIKRGNWRWHYVVHKSASLLQSVLLSRHFMSGCGSSSSARMSVHTERCICPALAVSSRHKLQCSYMSKTHKHFMDALLEMHNAEWRQCTGLITDLLNQWASIHCSLRL